MKLYATEGIGRYIAHFHRLGQTFLSKAYKDYDIGSGQYQFLIRLYLQDGVSHDELTEKMSVDKATTTRAILKLEEAGYVKRVLNEDDKRKYYIYLTEKALAQKDDILRISHQWEQQLVGSLTTEELDTLYLLLRKMAKHNPGCFFDEELQSPHSDEHAADSPKASMSDPTSAKAQPAKQPSEKVDQKLPLHLL